MGNAQRFTAIFYQFSFSPGDDGNLDTRCERTTNTVAIANVERFQLFTIIAHVTGHRTVRRPHPESEGECFSAFAITWH